tara:strand:- start:1196 stop:1645 length:450 start_codon:yes stop_codon:yes gene_type:complete
MSAIWFDSNDVGDTFEFGEVHVTEDEILEFAKKYDPQPFHVDKAEAENSIYGGLIASGWHTISMCMRLIVENMLIPDSGCLGSPGAENVTWSKPVRSGDVLKVKAELLDKIQSKSKPDRGFWVIKFVAINQNQEDVMNMSIKIYLRKHA